MASPRYGAVAIVPAGSRRRDVVFTAPFWRRGTAVITGKDLIQWGFKPGKWFPGAIADAQRMEGEGRSQDEIFAHLQTLMPVEMMPRTNALPFGVFLEPENDVERDNLGLVVEAMDALLRTPTVVSGVVMPDACPAGTIPVGGVVATRNAIHPGFHSADICCSMAITVFKRNDDPKKILDAAFEITHFGPGGRKDQRGRAMPAELSARFKANRFLSDVTAIGDSNLGTQGDGNHFLYVGHLRSTGQPAIVTHHGSRGPGAMLYKRGMAVARRHTAIVSPKTPPGAAWIEADTPDGRAYWDALQVIREWTKQNHFRIHDRIQAKLGNQIADRFWNEHNFVFRRDDGLFYHAKGATPSFDGFSPDDDGRTLIPMNMSEPILIAGHADKKAALGFSPHGAGRNMSRTRYLREVIGSRDFDDVVKAETNGLDIRFWLGTPDLSELPAAYKSASQVVGQIERHRLATIDDFVDPYGSIMAGDWQKDMPWRDRR
ncbi:MAG: RtcB family protein [Mesorhizobium sp.]|uniref:RtcB family protein n=2 Tax=unclassified Mesorhizobium TaxID=325217 RepID=UPI000F75197E|nr:RtcB family protein [Mesorhizobium sp. M4A.F.Ca.ET.090.04.2.1]AZO47752.1 RtcB family protein [Mesorhizobium sp. M4B.F.Ca.ET.058.02.1.1]RVC44494.1 RtcB family protein [Mesorhizobium sp. M4A.F.Ca.ET.090.04.2.1]RWC54655.1 MAG: RtcB family protein [Mesorhizobium sp.]TIV82474.1 MAG: RtcB family protein [Mesorhizobium sp.]